MIKLQEQVPSIYTSASRDFQYLSWLINIVLNSVKHNVDDLYEIPNVKHNPKLSELLALTLGFKIKRNYDQKQLAALVSILPRILKYKGTLKAVLVAAEALVIAAEALGNIQHEVNGTNLTITLPESATIDTTLFVDLLDYILPAGMTCRIIRDNVITQNVEKIDVRYSDTEIHYDVVKDIAWDNNRATGLSALFDIDIGGTGHTAKELSEKLSNLSAVDNGHIPNIGLLDNAIIPVMASDEEKAFDNIVRLYTTEEDGSHKLLRTQLPGTDSSYELKAEKSTQEL